MVSLFLRGMKSVTRSMSTSDWKSSDISLAPPIRGSTFPSRLITSTLEPIVVCFQGDSCILLNFNSATLASAEPSIWS